MMRNNITYIRAEDIIEKQAAAEKSMLEEFEKGTYTIENPLVKLDPYEINPCTAVVAFTTERETAVSITVCGKEPGATITHTFPKAKTHILPILGLYVDYENTVEVRLYQGYQKTITITTAPPDPRLAIPSQTDAKERNVNQGMIFFSTHSISRLPVAYDYNGDIRWYLSTPLFMAIKRLKNGHVLVGTQRILKYPYFASGMYEMDMVGKIYKEYSIPGGYHHDQWEMPDGDLLVQTQGEYSNTIEDRCVLLDRKTGDIKKVWDYADFLTPGEGLSGHGTPSDWFHNNSLWYDVRTNSITLSGRHIDALVNIDYETGALNWILGDPATWPKEKQKYFFTPIGDLEWQYEQHSGILTSHGDVMCFDNGCFRSKNKEEFIENKDNYSRAVRYKINVDDMTIEQVWQYGKEQGSEFFSKYISNVEYLGENHYLAHSGGKQFLDGIPSEALLSVDNPAPNQYLESVTVEILNDEKVFELVMEGNYYRAQKMHLYHNVDFNLSIGKGEKAGALFVTKEAEKRPVALIASTEPLPEQCKAHIVEHSDTVALFARFAVGSQVMIVLEQDNETHFYNVQTTGNKSVERCCAAYFEAHEDNTYTYVNKMGLSGDYDMAIAIEGKKYPTGVTIHC